MIDDYATIEEYVRKAMDEPRGYAHVTRRITDAEAQVRELESLAKNRLGQIRHLNKGLRDKHVGYRMMMEVFSEVTDKAKKKLATANEDIKALATALKSNYLWTQEQPCEYGTGKEVAEDHAGQPCDPENPEYRCEPCLARERMHPVNDKEHDDPIARLLGSLDD